MTRKVMLWTGIHYFQDEEILRVRKWRRKKWKCLIGKDFLLLISITCVQTVVAILVLKQMEVMAFVSIVHGNIDTYMPQEFPNISHTGCIYSVD